MPRSLGRRRRTPLLPRFEPSRRNYNELWRDMQQTQSTGADTPKINVMVRGTGRKLQHECWQGRLPPAPVHIHCVLAPASAAIFVGDPLAGNRLFGRSEAAGGLGFQCPRLCQPELR